MKFTPIILAGSLAASTTIVSIKEVTKLHKENEELKKEIKYSNEANRSSIEEVKEINKNNCKLIIYESSKGQYTKDLKENSFIPVNATLQTTYSYKCEIDLSKANVMDINGVTYVEIKYSDIKISSISIDQPKITNDLSFLAQFKGDSVSEINQQITIQAYEEIEKHIENDFLEKQDTLRINLQDKINMLYGNLDNVVVTYK